MILDVLAELGVEATLYGVEPVTEAEYLDRVKPANGATVPPWSEVEPMLAEVERAELIVEVRAECQRRLFVLTGARDQTHLDILLSDANREAIRLLRKGSGSWTADEATRGAALEAYDAAIEAVLAASSLLKSADPIPADFTADTHWPEGTS